MGSGDPAATRSFFAGFDPDARCIADPDGRWWAAFGLGRGSFGQLLGPAVVASALKAMLKGNGIGVPSGDPLRLGGWFLVEGDAVLWSHRGAHAGDHPGLDAVRTATRTTTSRPGRDIGTLAP